MGRSIQNLSKIVCDLSLHEGYNPTTIPYLSIYRFAEQVVTMPQTEVPYLYLVVDGSVRLHTPSGIMDYVAGQYSVSVIDTSNSGNVMTFSDQQDFLALAIEMTLNDVVSVVIELDDQIMDRIMNSDLEDSRMQEAGQQVIRSVYSLIELSAKPFYDSFISKHIKQEIIYHILCSACGKQFLQSIINIQQSRAIYEINSWIKQNFRNDFTVEELARQRNISVSLLHQRFKSAVGMGPLQCRNRLRLTEARRLMLDENKNVTEAAMSVGYDNVSQFTREYRKIFGQAPKEDILNIRQQLEK